MNLQSFIGAFASLGEEYDLVLGSGYRNPEAIRVRHAGNPDYLMCPMQAVWHKKKGVVVNYSDAAMMLDISMADKTRIIDAADRDRSEMGLFGFLTVEYRIRKKFEEILNASKARS
jgi:hypothetical protein